MHPTSDPQPSDILQLDTVSKVYGTSKRTVTALDDVSVGLRAGTFTAVMGASGSGKTTLLHCAAGLDRPSSGSVVLDGVDLSTLGERRLTRLRRTRIGFVFQAYNLLPALSVAENVALPLRLAGTAPRKGMVDDVLELVGLAGRRRARPNELSGGQQQRVAIARALITRPAVVFGDEPTGALDTRTGEQILALLRDAVVSWGGTVVMVTHDPAAAAHADRVLFLADGRIVADLHTPGVDVIRERMAGLDATSDRADAAPDAASAPGAALAGFGGRR
ncbi:ABC transporter ATP-binding protein [Streptomyces sp. SID3343]|uniref:ABC transporter ATP-binding protein n=1 Tax=Streptomyces sp. SID3343 TaxID=2690260 RepID=UPI001371A422|nr:ABC transporter ATP-binding protein [Streptomyces sp. SID3343]MYW00463.1 ATP-binding cassette domain-containing protein [Streptomyces sp. SID3343]